MRDLADLLACDPSYITGLADQLEERGLVTREAGADRRVKLLALTKKGATLRAKVSKAATEQAAVTRWLTDAERKTLEPLLERMLAEGPTASVALAAARRDSD
jgi:DNA-binding MarR family transcriptional regulator